MFKLIVLSALFALAAAKPSLLAPTAYVAAPAITKIVQPAPLLVSQPAQVGSVISSIPTGVSSQSSSVVHSSAPVVSSIVTPIQKTVVAAPLVSAPIYKTLAAPAYAYNAAPYAAAPYAYNAYANLW